MLTSIISTYSLAFVEGFALILSPCILPILPIVLAGGISGNHKRAIGIICGFTLTFALFTVFARSLIQLLHIDLDILRYFSYGLVILFGVILCSDYLSNKFNHLTQMIANIGEKKASSLKNEGLMGGFVLGACISLIWVPCGGPVLAAGIVQIATQSNSWQSFFIFLFFALGSIMPLIMLTFIGKQTLLLFNFLKQHSFYLRKIFGFIMIIATLFAAWMTPNDVNMPINTKFSDAGFIGLQRPYQAPELKGIVQWINSPPLSIQNLKGKVVLVDFWDYSCINCIRTFPYLKHWYDKYHDKGLVIIGVHSPEFEFEKKIDNLQKAVTKYQLPYPVAADNNFATWISFNNNYWPAHYLIDKNGNVVYVHFGEGNYDVTENNIRILLEMNPNIAKINPNVSARNQTPEIYLGYQRGINYQGSEKIKPNETNIYSYPSILPVDAWALKGNWKIEAERINNMNALDSIQLHFYAKKVFAVLGSSNNQFIRVQVLIDGKITSTIEVKEHHLYDLVQLDKVGSHTLELRIDSPGLEIYTFTFGSD